MASHDFGAQIPPGLHRLIYVRASDQVYTHIPLLHPTIPNRPVGAITSVVPGLDPLGEIAVHIPVRFGYRGPPQQSESWTRSWRSRRNMSASNTARATRTSAAPTADASTSNASHPTRTRLSLSNMITSSRLLRRLSTSPTSQSPPDQAFPNSHGPYDPSILDGPDHRRPAIPRSTTLPSIASGWELLDGDEAASVAPARPRAQAVRHTARAAPSPPPSFFPRRIPVEQGIIEAPSHLSPSTVPPITPTTTPIHPASAPTSPCQRVWLCSPPRPSGSPVLAEPRCQRRPAITTRALSNARLAKEFDENGTLVNISAHSDRVLAKGAMASGSKSWRERNLGCPRTGASGSGSREEQGLGLARSQSAVLPAMSEPMARPEHHRAETTGHGSYFAASSSTSALANEGRPRESGSQEPLLENDDREEVIRGVGRRKSKGMMGM